MPNQTGRKWISHEQKARRHVSLAFVLIALLFALNFRFGFFAGSDSAFAQKSAGGRLPKEETRQITRNDCSYLQDPEEIKQAMAEHRELISQNTEMLTRTAEAAALQAEAALVPPQDIPRKNFIDNILFDKMARDNVMSAAVSTDEEFIRRVYLDITGRIPSAQ
ncbi:MAG: hypothetical protein ACREEM_36090, partial [Blastocatellia bacterium]